MLKLPVQLCSLLAFTALFLFVSPSLADEIRIIDQLGLTRAVRESKGPQTVYVSFHQGSIKTTSSVLLIHRDGVAPDRVGEVAIGGTAAVFHEVTAGTWQLKFPPSIRKIGRVKIGD